MGPARPIRRRRLDRRSIPDARCGASGISASEDYAYQQASLTAKKLRLLEVRAGSPSHKEPPHGDGRDPERMRAAEHELAAQAESACKRLVAEWQRTQAKRNRAPARHWGAHLVGRQAAKQRRRSKPVGRLFSSSSTDARDQL